jgi:hypothetical protein
MRIQFPVHRHTVPSTPLRGWSDPPWQVQVSLVQEGRGRQIDVVAALLSATERADLVEITEHHWLLFPHLFLLLCSSPEDSQGAGPGNH